MDPWGDFLIEESRDQEQLLTCEIDLAKINQVRLKIPVFSNRRPDFYGDLARP